MSSDNKSTITPMLNGPYVIKNLNHFTNQNEKIETKETMTLCRCGASNNKPFCDGEHLKIGFTSEKHNDHVEDKRQSYKGKNITIHDNRGICAHAGYCTGELAAVFRFEEGQGIDPDSASVDEIIAIIEKCPSGALNYSIDDEEHIELKGELKVFIAPNGPYVVSGECELLDTTWCEGALHNQFTLCRCGGSKNKPFCDGTHWYINFTDDKN